MSKILDVGCGCSKIAGATGLDIDKNSHADIIHDLNVYPYPVEDDSFDQIYARHIIEHLDHPDKFVFELKRIIKPGGSIFIETPHFSNYVCWTEHGHKFFFSYFMMINIVKPTSLDIVDFKITFYKTFRHFGIQWLANLNPENYERFWTYIFPAENLKIKLSKAC